VDYRVGPFRLRPKASWASDTDRVGGVRGLVIGPLVFYKDVPRFDFTYARPGVQYIILKLPGGK